MPPPEVIHIGSTSWLWFSVMGFLALGLLAGLAGGIAMSPPERRLKTVLWSVFAVAIVYGLISLEGIPASFTQVSTVEIAANGDWVLKNNLGLRLDTLASNEPKRIGWYDETFTVLRPRQVLYLTGLRIVTAAHAYDTVAYDIQNEQDLQTIKDRLDQRIQDARTVLPEDVIPPAPSFLTRYQQDLILLFFFLYSGTFLLVRYIQSWRKPA